MFESGSDGGGRQIFAEHEQGQAPIINRIGTEQSLHLRARKHMVVGRQHHDAVFQMTCGLGPDEKVFEQLI